MTQDAELDALENNLAVRGKQDREMSNHYVHRMEVDRVAAKSAITTLRAQLAEQIGYKNDYKAAFIETNDDWQEAKARADRAEQRVATLEHEVRLREAALSIANATLAALIEKPE